MMLTTILFTCVLIYFLYKFKIWCSKLMRYRSIVNKFPGREANFFIGDVLSLEFERDKLFQQLRGWFEEFPTGFRGWGGFFAAFNFNRTEEFEIILSSPRHISKDYLYRFFKSWMGDGLLISEGEKWHRRRKLLTPAFHFNILKKFVIVFEEHSKNLINILAEECEKEKTNIMPIATKLTLDIICETAMGTRLENSDKQEQYRKAIQELGDLLILRVINVHHYYDWFYFKFVPSGWKFKKNLKILHEFTDDVIKERERTFKDSDVEDLEKEEEDFVYSKKKRFAMLDLLISAKRNTGEIDDAGIREEVDTFMFEGHDTTAMAISFIVLMLANYKDVQEKARAEVDQIFQGSTRPANYKDLQSMTYLDLVIKETLRLYPSVPIIGRTITESVPFRNGKYKMPSHSLLMFYIYFLHRDPEVFPDPEKFDPDRFLPENSKDRNPYSYVPFSAGPRNCIGQRFAILELKSTISSILRHYEIDPVDRREDLVMMIDLMLRPKNGIHVKFKLRTKYST